MSSYELSEWMAHDRVKFEEDEKRRDDPEAAKQADEEARAERDRPAPGILVRIHETGDESEPEELPEALLQDDGAPE